VWSCGSLCTTTKPPCASSTSAPCMCSEHLASALVSAADTTIATAPTTLVHSTHIQNICNTPVQPLTAALITRCLAGRILLKPICQADAGQLICQQYCCTPKTVQTTFIGDDDDGKTLESIYQHPTAHTRPCPQTITPQPLPLLWKTPLCCQQLSLQNQILHPRKTPPCNCRRKTPQHPGSP